MATRAGFSQRFWGRKDRSSRTCRKQSGSEAATKWQTPDLTACALQPPRRSKLTSSPVAALTTSGPVTNMWLMPSTMKMKSVRAGE